jgi:hypothetical protein
MDGWWTYAVATLELENGVVVRLACSWRIPRKRRRQLATFYGMEGGAASATSTGSFFDFTVER